MICIDLVSFNEIFDDDDDYFQMECPLKNHIFYSFSFYSRFSLYKLFQHKLLISSLSEVRF